MSHAEEDTSLSFNQPSSASTEFDKNETTGRRLVPSAEGYALLQTAQRDRIYTMQEASAFAFGEQVAEVFDDMISRSVPYYLDLQLLAVSSAVRFYTEGSAIYDLGCSTGTTLALIAKRFPESTPLFGVDSSKPMLDKAQEKLEKLKVLHQIQLICENVEDVIITTSSFVMANYTLQFIPITRRAAIVKKVYDSLVPGGAFLVSEKTIPNMPESESEIIKDLHEDFKLQNGYTSLEVARKRESLKGVMIPLTEETNTQMFQEAGFSSVIPVFRGYSFISWLCVK